MLQHQRNFKNRDDKHHFFVDSLLHLLVIRITQELNSPHIKTSHTLWEKAAVMDGLSILLDGKSSKHSDPRVFHHCVSHSIWDTMSTCHQYLWISLWLRCWRCLYVHNAIGIKKHYLRHFPKEIQMANTHMKRCSTPLTDSDNRYVQTKTRMRHHLTLARMAII